MNGYYIQVTNNLLDAKHRENMGESVWLFMWLLDKMTSTTEEGVGKVLGGKPIKHEEVAEALGLSQRTYTRYIERLMEHEYIKATRTPYGYVFHVMKAKKTFGKRVATSGASDEKRYAKSGGLDTPHVAGKTSQSGVSNKTVTVDNTVDNTTGEASSPDGKLISEVIHLLETVDPKNKHYYRNTTQRDAVSFLLTEYGFDAIRQRITFLPKSNRLPHFPVITSPIQLRDKWIQLDAAVERLKAEKVIKNKVAF